MYAIIATGGKQYKVAEGDVIRVEKLGAEAGSTYTFDQVLLVGGEDVKVGNPTVAGATVEASVVGDGKAKKVIVYKYKRKTGYHKKNGHRQPITEVEIGEIIFGAKPKKKAASRKKAKAEEVVEEVAAIEEAAPVEAVEEVAAVEE